MHSTLRKELCGTPKILQSARTRSTIRSTEQRRRFSSKTYFLNQSGPKDNNANCSPTTTGGPDNLGETSAGSNAPAQGLSAELEKWIQVYSDRGQSLNVWDTISETDENGKRRLLPHIKKDLEKLSSRTGQDGSSPQTIGLEIQDGRVRPLTSSELRQKKEAGTASSGHAEKVILRTDEESKDTPHLSPTQAAEINDSASARKTGQAGDKEKGQQELSTGGEGSPLDPEIAPPKFHGSAAARRQRDRQSRQRDKAQSVALPKWFQERNIILWGELQPRATQSAHVSSVVGKIEQSNIDGSIEGPSVDSEPTIPPSSAEANLSQINKEPDVKTREADSVVEKKQAFASEPGGNQPSGNSNASTAYDDEKPSAELFTLPNSRRRYHIYECQRTELIMTARGRLRLPATRSTQNKNGGIRSHILVHYTAKDGDIFLDRLVEDVAQQLHCNLITLDAQDISALILKGDIDPMLADEAKTLSYDVYSSIYEDEVPDDTPQSMFPEDMEDGDEDGPQGPRGLPFAIGKPITIDLKAIFGPKPRKGASPFLPKNLMGDMMGRSTISKPMPHIFQSLIDSILSSPGNKRKLSDGDASQQTQDGSSGDTTKSQVVPQDATIVHVKDLRTIQEEEIGKHFLTQLYEQVERRRNNGEAIMLIGTSCERGDVPKYDADRIRSLQVSEPEEISSTIVITPAYRVVESDTPEEALRRDERQRTVIPIGDRTKRIQIVNARHLYEMLQSKDVTLGSLKDGFWTRNFTEELVPSVQVCLADFFWSYSYVQRLAAILASSDHWRTSSGSIAEAVRILEHSDQLKIMWADAARQHRPKRPRKPSQGKKTKSSEEIENEKLAGIRSTATKHEKKLLSGVIEPKKMATTFKDIHIPAETVDALQTLTTLSLVRPDAFKYGVLASDRIPGLLLYGPPGTGKTLAAKAVARESGATMLEVSAADINDMYVGEGEKNVKALFSLAKKLSPCVVFLDEADAMFSARSSGAGRRVSHRELLNQFLKEWDGMSNDSGSAFIMVATNRPMDLDDAVLRRLPRRLLIDLPSEKDRIEILKIHLRHEKLTDDVDLAKLAARTQFYSGSDLKNVAVAAALNCVREENQLAKNHTGTEPYQYPQHRTLTSKHFESALEEISASISEDMTSLREIKKFDEQYGDRKGRKRKSPKWGFKTATEADAVLDTVKVRS